MITKKYSLFSVFLIVTLTSCSVKEVQKESPFINDIKINERFRIKLPENHSKAEMWQLKENFDGETVELVNATWHGDEKGIYFYLKGKRSGMTNLSFFKRIYADTVESRVYVVKVSQD